MHQLSLASSNILGNSCITICWFLPVKHFCFAWHNIIILYFVYAFSEASGIWGQHCWSPRPVSKAEEILSARVRPGPCPPMEPLSKCSLAPHQKPLSRSLTCCSPKAVGKSSTFFHTQSILATASNLSSFHSKDDFAFFHSHRLELPKNNLSAHSDVHLSLPQASLAHSHNQSWPQNLS